jgi:hypothetical protein
MVPGLNVGAGPKPVRHGDARRCVQINAHAFLVAIEHREKARTGAQQAARAVACYGLDLDDFGAHVGQHHAAGRAHDHVGEFNDAQAGKRLGRAWFLRVLHEVFFGR